MPKTTPQWLVIDRSMFRFVGESLGLDNLLDLLLHVLLHLLSSGGEGLVLLGLLPEEDAGDLDDTDDAEEEVDGGETVRKRGRLVFGL